MLSMLLIVPSAWAQTIQGSISVTGGSATDVLGVTSRAATISPAVTFTPDPNATLTLSAGGTRFDNAQWSGAGSLAAALRAPLAPWAAATLDADGGVTRTSYQFSYATAGLLPAVEVTGGPVTAYGGARVAVGGVRTATSATHASVGGLVGATLRFAGANGETTTFGARVERTQIDSIAQLDRAGTVVVSRGALEFSGAVGVRDELQSAVAFGSVGLSVAVNPTMTIDFGAGRYPANQLVGTPAGRFMSIGATLRTGVVRPHAPEASGAPVVVSGLTRLTIRADDARRVDVAGDFTNWQPIAARRADNGVWYVDLRIPAGRYRYAFRENGTRWIVPTGVETVDDGFGGTSAWLVVSTP